MLSLISCCSPQPVQKSFIFTTKINGRPRIWRRIKYQKNTGQKNLAQWIIQTGDPGAETLDVYILETEDQMSSTGNKDSRENYRKNSETYKKWFTDGK